VRREAWGVGLAAGSLGRGANPPLKGARGMFFMSREQGNPPLKGEAKQGDV